MLSVKSCTSSLLALEARLIWRERSQVCASLVLAISIGIVLAVMGRLVRCSADDFLRTTIIASTLSCILLSQYAMLQTLESRRTTGADISLRLLQIPSWLRNLSTLLPVTIVCFLQGCLIIGSSCFVFGTQQHALWGTLPSWALISLSSCAISMVAINLARLQKNNLLAPLFIVPLLIPVFISHCCSVYAALSASFSGGLSINVLFAASTIYLVLSLLAQELLELAGPS